MTATSDSGVDTRDMYIFVLTLLVVVLLPSEKVHLKFSWLKAVYNFFKAVWHRACAFVRCTRFPWRKITEGKVFPTTVGFFAHRDEDDEKADMKYYYRFPAELGGTLVRLHAAGGLGIGDNFKVYWKREDLARPKSCGESAIPGGKFVRCADQTLWKGVFKVNTTDGAYDSMGVNVGGCAVVAGHCLRERSFIVISGNNSKTAGVKVATSRFIQPENVYDGGATDFAVAKLDGNEWAMIGAKALSNKDFADVAACSVDIQFGNGVEGELYTSPGRLPQQVKAAEEAGIVLTKVSTQGGCSGSVYRRFVGGVPKYTAFHIARPADYMAELEGSYNVAVDFNVIFSFMRDHGLYHDTVFEALRRVAIGESTSEYSFDGQRESRDYDDVKKFYADPEMWERTQERIAQQVMGDEWTRYDTGKAGRRARRNLDVSESSQERPGESAPRDVPPPPGLELDSEKDKDSFINSDDTVHGCAPAGLAQIPEEEPFVFDEEEEEPSGEPVNMKKVGVAGCAIWLALKSLNFVEVKRQVINSDFSFAPALYDAVGQYGVDAVHDYVMGTDAFALFRDYMDVVQPSWSQFTDNMKDENGAAFFEKVGEYRVDGVKQATSPDRKKKTKPLSPAAIERANAVRALIKDLGCEDTQWVTPENTKANLMASMKAHAALASVAPPSATEEDWDAALEAGCQQFDTTPLQSHAERGFEGWYKLAASFEDTSSGVSARYRNMTKKKWANDPELVFAMTDFVQSRLILMLIHHMHVENYTPEQVVKYGLKDVILLTLKGEPHKPEKVKQGRFRMIWVSSLIDTFVQKLLHKALNARDIEQYQSGEKSHSAAGMGHHDEGVQHLCRAFDDMFGDEEFLLTCDASMWDFTMFKKAHLNHAKRRVKACKDPAVSKLIMVLAHVNYKHVCECKGDVWRCNKEGVNTSGQASTTGDNTFSRCSQALVCGAKKFIGNGDDMVADVGFQPKLAERFGTKSRDVVVQRSDIVPFTSHHIDRKTCTASYDRPVKLAWNLLAACSSGDFGLRVDAMLYVIRNTPGALAKFKKHLDCFANGSGTFNSDLLWAA